MPLLNLCTAHFHLPEAAVFQRQFLSVSSNELHLCRAAAVVSEELVGVAAEEAEQSQLVRGD